MRWWVSDPNRWDLELADMLAWFPDWTWFETTREHQVLGQEGFVRELIIVRVWEGELQPLPDDAHEARRILSDLEKDRQVTVDVGGVLRHDPGCTQPHESLPEAVQSQSRYNERFFLSTEHWAPPAHPKAYALRPYLGPELYFTQKHINLDGSLCPYTPTDGEWNGREDTLSMYLRRGISIFLAKHLYWTWTAANGAGRWPGRTGPHGELQAMLQALSRHPTVPCRCGNGPIYQDCHRPIDEAKNADILRYALREIELERKLMRIYGIRVG